MLDILLRQGLTISSPTTCPTMCQWRTKPATLDYLMHDAQYIVYAPSGPFVIVVLAQGASTPRDATTNPDPGNRSGGI